MRIVVHWLRTVFIVAVGVTAILLLCNLSKYGTVPHKVLRQWSGWDEPPEEITSCGNGSRSCTPSDQKQHIADLEELKRNNPPGNEAKTKALTKYRVKQVNHLEKLIKRRKTILSAEQNKHNSGKSEKREINKDVINSWRQALSLDTFDMVEFEDSNISEEASLEVTSSLLEDVQVNIVATVATRESPQNAGSYTERSRTGRKRPTRKQAIFKPIMTHPVPEPRSKLQLHELHPHDPENVASATCNYPSVNIIFSYMVGGLLATAAASLSAIVIDSIYTYVKACISGMPSRNRKLLKDVEQHQIEVDSDCNLAKLPLDLQEILTKKLDVRVPRKGQRFYGWQKVGAAYNVPIDDLRYLKLEYKRDTGSPTSKLLEILGITYGITISNFVGVLTSPEVNRPDITSIIKLT